MVKKINDEIINKFIEYKNSGLTLKQIAEKIEQEYNIKITPRTIWNYLNKNKKADTEPEPEWESTTQQTEDAQNAHCPEGDTEQTEGEEDAPRAWQDADEIENNNVVVVNNSEIMNEIKKDEWIEVQIQQQEEPKIPIIEFQKPNPNIYFNNINKKRSKSQLKWGNNSILSTIRKVKNNNDDLETMKKKRWTIVIIRQYLNTFEDKLKTIYGKNKLIFEKKLFGLWLDELNIILENIRIELNVWHNKNMFVDTTKSFLIGYEKLLCFSGVDVSGVWDELNNDPEFLFNLKQISCEYDIWQYINPKTSTFFKVVKTTFMKHKQNKMLKKIEWKITPDKLEELKKISISENKNIDISEKCMEEKYISDPDKLEELKKISISENKNIDISEKCMEEIKEKYISDPDKLEVLNNIGRILKN